ncbi:MFS transporter [Rubrobacter calidifluminis]|uniref:MFS transporter n=1 Tax=Rubrobacter calidifluminis TaxID=1392640 RepID=UPI00235FA240|nr:MFS transporter [Rubrobacter calidifluminis]
MGVFREDSAGVEAGGSLVRRVALASFIGTAVEWYDFFLFGTASALVFGRLFFPNVDPALGTLASFGTLAVGFVARPVGGVLFGHYGDRIGRKAMLVMTLLIMGVATLGVGLLPTYQQVGIWAPVLLLLLRVLQSIGVGGEWGGGILMAVEHAGGRRRGFYGGWQALGSPVGLGLGTAVFMAFSLLPDRQFFEWGWRVPFLLSVVLVGIGLYIRLRVAESPVFAGMERRGIISARPVADLWRYHRRSLLFAMGARLAEGLTFNLYAIWSLDYISGDLGIDRNVALGAIVAASAVAVGVIPAFASLSDRVGRRPVYMLGAAFSALFSFPFFLLVDSGEQLLITLAIVLGLAFGTYVMGSVEGCFFSEMFDPRVRYSGASIAFQLSGVVASGPAPLVAAGLLAWSGGSPWPVALLVAVVSTVSLVSAWLAGETYRRDISGSIIAGQEVRDDEQAA